MPESAPVVLIGSACLDVRGRIHAPFQPAYANAGRVRIAPGGTARNIAENLARLDVPSRLLTAVGDDVPGRQILYYTRAAGVSLDNESLLVHQGRASGAYLAIERDDGELALAIDDTTITRTITPRIIHRWRRFLRDAALVVADATLRPQTLATIARLCRQAGVDLCFEPVSVALAPRIAPFIADATL